jgi:intracellular septation protein
MAATAIALAASWVLTRTLPMMPLVSGIVVLIFGALTLYLQDDVFIKMKPTIVNTLFGGVLLGGLLFGKSLLGYVFNSAFSLDAEGWKKLTFRWGLFFFVLAILNEVVWRNFSTDFWVAFKVWATMPITILFTLSQMPLIMRHSLENKGEEGGKAGK